MKAGSLNITIKNNPRTVIFFQKEQEKVYQKANRLFAVLMPLQWLAAIIITFVATSPQSEVIPHFWLAILGGGFITLVPTFLALKYSGKKITRYVAAVGQILVSVLLIQITGGWIEAYFHLFGSLALLAFYRDWRILIPASIVAIADHILRGWYYGQTVYGFSEEWRWAEYTVWIVFEVFFLAVSCRLITKEMWDMAVYTTALDDSEARYRAVVEQITEGIFILSQETLDVIECNEAFVKLIGYESVEEVRKLNAFDFDIAKPEEIEMMTRIVREENRSISGERRYRRKDGSIIFVEIVGRCIAYGEIIAYCVNVRDITERKKAEKEMKRLALVAQKTQNGVVITNPEGLIQWVNPGFTQITGYEFAEVEGIKPGKILQGKETNVETIFAIRKAIQEQKPFAGEIYNYRKDGKGYWVSIAIMPFHNEKGVHKGFIGIEIDITERKQLENDLRKARDEMEIRVAERTEELGEAQQFLRKVIDNIPNLIFVKDKSGRYTLANQAFANSYGKNVEGVIGKTDLELIGDTQDVEKFNLSDRKVIEEKLDVIDDEVKFIDADGATHWFQSVKRLFLGNSGLEYILGIATDLTERKVLESQLRHAQKLESIGQLAAGIAHEINTPTQYVGDNTRFIRDSFTDINRVLEKYDELFQKAKTGNINNEILDEIKKEIADADLEYLIEEVPNAIQQSLEGVSRIAKIVQSMKDFAHPGVKEKQTVDLNRAIESTLTVARNEWKYVADMETSFDSDLPPVPCFLGEFNQVILNMVVNASHAIQDVIGDGSHGKGKISISTTKVNENWAEIRISDTGTGIPTEARSRIFDPFFTTKEVGKGTGQGLAISHTVVVEKHHGKLSFETESGKGTTFIIQLPLDQATLSRGS